MNKNNTAAQVRLLRDRIAALGRELHALEIEGLRYGTPPDLYAASDTINGIWRLLDDLVWDLEAPKDTQKGAQGKRYA